MWRRWRRRWRGRGYRECPCRDRACPARSLTVESPLTVCFVGRGLDPSATSRETAVNGISVGEGFIPPVYLPSPLTSAGRRGRRPLQWRSVNLPPPHTPAGGYGIRPYAQTKPPCRGRACPARSLTVESPLTVCFVGRGLDPSATSRETAVNGISVGEGFIPPVYLPSPLTSAGRRGRRPLQWRSVNLPPPHTPAGGYGIRPYAQTKPPCRGRACPARSLAVAARLSFAS